MILDLSDQTWLNYFTEKEINEMISFQAKSLPRISLSINQYLNQIDQLNTADEFFGKNKYHFQDSWRYRVGITDFIRYFHVSYSQKNVVRERIGSVLRPSGMVVNQYGFR